MKQFFGIPSETRYGFTYYPVDFTHTAITEQSLKFIAFFHFCTRDPFVRINIDQFVFRMFFDIVCKMQNLCRIRMLLFVR